MTTPKILSMAFSVAALIAAAPLASAGDKPADDGGKVKCSGVNKCSGKGSCKSAKNACAGKNGCGGKGWILLTEKECTDKGGKVLPKT